ncbi:hypothetical protein MNBD_ALPHA08-2027 [hydrothermal vent metagenome]|uniref:Uncharacterized protein n=1 Tax=hydrothermal vent metagenome TaxID=652676 RepID=A0A3B0RK56_9ZZZZ
MMRIKSSTAALVAIFGFMAFVPGSAQADPRHWFYNNYDRYDDRAYYDDGYDDGEDQYYVYAPPPRQARRSQWQRRQDRLRRWANRQARKVLRRENRKNRNQRQRLYDARQGDQYGRYERPHRDRVKKTKPRKHPKKLARVPLPRTKPYHLIPSQMAALPVDPAATTAPVAVTDNSATLDNNKRKIKKFTLDSATNPAQLDERPVWKTTPDKQPSKQQAKKIDRKKGVKVAALPKVITPTPAKPETAKTKTEKPKTTTTFKPIRIEVVKNPKTAGLRKPAQRQASNQLSCDKAKSIVTDFGFSDVTARTCTGTVYDFNAKRDGNPYSVKVSSLSGELKGVKKIK